MKYTKPVIETFTENEFKEKIVARASSTFSSGTY